MREYSTRGSRHSSATVVGHGGPTDMERVGALLQIIAMSAIGYVIWHFVTKYW